MARPDSVNRMGANGYRDVLGFDLIRIRGIFRFGVLCDVLRPFLNTALMVQGATFLLLLHDTCIPHGNPNSWRIGFVIVLYAGILSPNASPAHRIHSLGFIADRTLRTNIGT